VGDRGLGSRLDDPDPPGARPAAGAPRLRVVAGRARGAPPRRRRVRDPVDEGRRAAVAVDRWDRLRARPGVHRSVAAAGPDGRDGRRAPYATRLRAPDGGPVHDVDRRARGVRDRGGRPGARSLRRPGARVRVDPGVRERRRHGVATPRMSATDLTQDDEVVELPETAGAWARVRETASGLRPAWKALGAYLLYQGLAVWIWVVPILPVFRP